MGHSRWNPSDWASYSRSTATKSRAGIFKRRTMSDALNPRNIKIRESRDSDSNPESNAIIIAGDVTGSMGMIAETLIRKGIGVAFQEILDRKPVSDPHLMVMGVGDVNYDSAPLQVTQFEAGLAIAEQTAEIFLEGGGGGNAFESYDLPWYFAATRTAIDCFEKRGKKGYLFTVGDEPPSPGLQREAIVQVFGDSISQDLPAKDLLTMAERYYDVFHIIVEEGHFASRAPDRVTSAWRELLGERVIGLSDYTLLSEVIVSAIQVNEGVDKAVVAGSWSGATSLVVANAVRDLSVTGDGNSRNVVLRF